jgi:hypothetical protein
VCAADSASLFHNLRDIKVKRGTQEFDVVKLVFHRTEHTCSMVKFCEKYVWEDVYILFEGSGDSNERKYKCVHTTILLLLSWNKAKIFLMD